MDNEMSLMEQVQPATESELSTTVNEPSMENEPLTETASSDEANETEAIDAFLKTESTFEELGVSGEILRAIKEMGYVNPMPVQEKAV